MYRQQKLRCVNRIFNKPTVRHNPQISNGDRVLFSLINHYGICCLGCNPFETYKTTYYNTLNIAQCTGNKCIDFRAKFTGVPESLSNLHRRLQWFRVRDCHNLLTHTRRRIFSDVSRLRTAASFLTSNSFTFNLARLTLKTVCLDLLKKARNLKTRRPFPLGMLYFHFFLHRT